MITNFETLTDKLTEKELKAVPIVVDLLNRSTKPVTNNEITAHLSAMNSTFQFGGIVIRKLINYIRLTKKVKNLLASAKGYYISENEKEIKRYIQSLNDRISAIVAIRDSYEKIL